jgi:hypothetical protein
MIVLPWNISSFDFNAHDFTYFRKFEKWNESPEVIEMHLEIHACGLTILINFLSYDFVYIKESYACQGELFLD